METLNTYPENPLGSIPQNRVIKILVVDDEPGWRDLLSLELSSQGFQIVTSSSAAEALSLLEKSSFHLIITDVRMPGGMDGVDLIETYKQENPAQKVIFITGYATEDKIEKALLPGLRYCVKKPIVFEDFFRQLSAVLTN